MACSYEELIVAVVRGCVQDTVRGDMLAKVWEVFNRGLILIHLQTHSVMDLIISQGDVVLIYIIPAQTFDR